MLTGLLALEVAGIPNLAIAVVAALLLGILLAPVEYAIGALACSFVAACAIQLGPTFLFARWVFLGLGAVILSLRFFLRRRSDCRERPNKFAWLLALFLVVSVATLMVTPSPKLTVLKLGALMCLFYVASRSVRHVVEIYGPASPRRLSHGLLAYALGFIVMALTAYFLTSRLTADPGRFAGYLANPNAWGGFAAAVLPWMACPLFRRAYRSRVVRAVLWLGVFGLGYTVLLSESRSAIVGTLVALTLFCTIHGGRRTKAVFLLASVCVTVQLLAQPDLIHVLSRRYVFKDVPNSQDADQAHLFRSRAEPWKAAQNNFRESPWLGLGFGVTSRAESNWSLDFSSGPGAIETGSSVLGSLVQVGILGATPLFLGIVFLLIEAGRFAWRVKDPWLTGIYGSTLSLTVSALFEGWLLAPGSFPTSYFWVQCFFLNALFQRFQPAPCGTLAASVSPDAESWRPGEFNPGAQVVPPKRDSAYAGGSRAVLGIPRGIHWPRHRRVS